jgi:hypothetical protein
VGEIAHQLSVVLSTDNEHFTMKKLQNTTNSDKRVPRNEQN